MSNIVLNLNDDPDPKTDYSWVKPGKYMGVWWEMIGTNESTWWQSKYHGAKTEKVKYSRKPYPILLQNGLRASR